MYEPEVTIITPTHNIVKADKANDFMLLIGLLSKQNYPYIEHIIIDNASTDETITLLKDYKNEGYIKFYSEPDRGKFDAYNKGIMRAKGKYVAFLSCDDFYHDITGIYDVVNLMEENGADYCFFPAYCRQDEDTVFLFTPSIYNVFQVMPFARQACIFKREAVESVGNFDIKFKLFADYDLIMRMVLAGCKGVFFDNNIVTYPLGEKAAKNNEQLEIECMNIYYKNLRPLYSFNQTELERMAHISEVPPELLEKLSEIFPPEDKDLFYERCEYMYKMRKQAAQARRRR